MEEQLNDGRLFLEAGVVAYLAAPDQHQDHRGSVRRREIGYLKIGRALVFPKSALDAYIAAHTVQSPNPWGLADLGLPHVLEERPQRRGRTL